MGSDAFTAVSRVAVSARPSASRAAEWRAGSSDILRKLHLIRPLNNEPDTRTIDGKAFGTMLLLLPDDPNEAAKALSYIRSQPNITAEEVEYHA